MGQVFETWITVRFQHCDPAGIVFFPRWYEMLNEAVEAWFDEGLGCDFHDLHMERHCGIPAIRTEADYRSPGMLGEHILWRLWIVKLGGSSIALRVEAVGPDQKIRVAFDHTVIFAAMGPPPKAKRVPDDLRKRMENFVVAGPTTAKDT
jgi:4-hydroxybenzoyl-CoA thioesterase